MTGGTARLPSSPLVVGAALIGAALGAWIVTLERMRDMDAGPGTELGTLGWYLGVWVTMMAAMMLSSAVPMVRLYAQISRGSATGRRAFVPKGIFVGGYRCRAG